MEVLERLDRIIDLLDHMNNSEIKSIRNEVSELHDWKISCQTERSSRSHLIQMFRWIGPWLLAFLFILFEHKMKIL